jgi:hypothetical protein
MGGSAPPVDYKGVQDGISMAASNQNRNNRLDTANPFASQTFNEDGSTSTQLTGGLGQAAQGLMGQAGQIGQPMDWSRFGQLGTGDSARDQAVNAAYGQSTSRLDPMWNQREEQTRTRLLQQGLDPNSEAARNQMTQFGQQRNDAYQGALNSAIGQGTAAGDSVFRNNMMSRQQGISEALQQRGMPLNELRQLQGFLGQPGYNTDNSTLSAALGGSQFAAKGAEQDRDEFMRQQEQDSGTAAGVMSGIGTAAAVAAMFF